MANIILIEDNLDNADIMIRLLTHHGHAVVHAEKGWDGIQLARNHPVDLILLDIHLPDLDGKMIANHLQRQPQLKDIPIIAVSADNTPTNRRLALRYGCSAFISKPINPYGFVAQIEGFLAGNPPAAITL